MRNEPSSEVRHARRPIVNQFEVMALAATVPALKRIGNNGAQFKPAPRASTTLISGRAVRDLVDAGIMEFGNNAHSFAVLTKKWKR